jgi:hypothetical protein
MQEALEKKKGQYQDQNFALVRTELPSANVQNGNKEQQSASIAAHCMLMERYCSLIRETTFKRVPAASMYIILIKYGLATHIGTGATPSKTETMYFLPLRRLYSDEDIPRLDVFDWGILLVSSALQRN